MQVQLNMFTVNLQIKEQVVHEATSITNIMKMLSNVNGDNQHFTKPMEKHKVTKLC